MKISDLQKLLAATKRKHGDLELLETRYSDYKLMDADSWTVTEAVPGPTKGDWLMRKSPTMSEEQKTNARKYLHFQGN